MQSRVYSFNFMPSCKIERLKIFSDILANIQKPYFGFYFNKKKEAKLKHCSQFLQSYEYLIFIENLNIF